jgi:SAM-dependent methyltransferase
MDYSEKENYITVHKDPNMWRYHANYHIMQAAREYIKGDVCDLGCNHGACTLLLLDFPEVKSIQGIDINMKALEVAYDTAIQIKTDIKINLYCANLTNVPLAEESQDFAMSFHTLEHIYPEDAPKVVSEIYRILRSGGHFLISIPYDHAYPDEHHVAFYTEKSLKILFESNGFKTIDCFKDDRFNQKDLLTGIFQKRILE